MTYQWKTSDHRRWQITLRSLLLLMAVTGAALAPAVNRARQQATVVRAVRRGGGECRYSHQYRRRPGYFGRVDPDAKPRWPDWLVNRLGIDFFENVAVVVLRGDLDPDVIQSIAALNTLEELYIVKRRLLQSDVRQLRALKKLRLLYLQLSGSPDEELLDVLERELPDCCVIPMAVKGK